MIRTRLKQALLAGPRKVVYAMRRQRARQQYRREFHQFDAMSRQNDSTPRLSLGWRDRFPILIDRTAHTGFDRHYVYHTSWAARVVARNRPAEHIDISSSLYFCGIVSAFVPVKFYDYRPADLKLSNLVSEHADLTNLAFESNSIASLSCMHVVEHVGLGRYGDPLDPDGDLKAMRELARVLAPGGSLMFVVPVGRPRIQFNAHRIYAHRQIVEYFSKLKLRQFALIPDDPKVGGLIEDAPEQLADEQSYGCGCFWFQKDP